MNWHRCIEIGVIVKNFEIAFLTVENSYKKISY